MMFADHERETWDATLNLVVRTSGDPSTAVAALCKAVKAHDPTLAIRDVRAFDDVVGLSLAPRRFALGLASAFAIVALLLAAVGIYGVLAYAVSNRTREFGVRLALGASPRSVVTLVLKHGLVWSSLGLVVGIAAAMAAGKVLSNMLYNVSAVDPITYILVALRAAHRCGAGVHHSGGTGDASGSAGEYAGGVERRLLDIVCLPLRLTMSLSNPP